MRVRVGFDVTALYVARAGVFTYRARLACALAETAPQHDYVWLDYRPARGPAADPPEVQVLGAVLHCRGLRHCRLARWDLLQPPPWRALAALVDRALLWPWAVAAGGVMRRRLSAALEGVDVFHASAVLPWRQPGAANVITIHDLSALQFPELHTPNNRELHRRACRFAQEEADSVIVVSEATRRAVVADLGIPAQRVYVVYNGVDAAFRPLADREAVVRTLAPFGLVPGQYILHVGTLEPRKNLERLVSAYAGVRQALSSLAPTLVLVGAKGWGYRSLFERVDALGLAGHIRFLDWVPAEALLALYNGAVLFVYPSLYEGFGLPPLEAMACGVPVLASDAASLPEVVGEAGLLLPPEDTTAWTDAIVALLRDPARRDALRQAGLARAARFSWARAARETLAVYTAAK
ncbi:MAG: glycosyltransferase family 4 protein [Anaerolineae bacterium]|nr:glycosyltransferase family 4 protein [Anaerolineae bacterium]